MKVLLAESHNLDRPDPLGSHQYISLFRQAGHDCLWLGPAVSPLHILKPDAVNRHRLRIWRQGLREINGISWLIPLTLLFYYKLPLFGSLYAGRNQYRFCLPPLADSLEKAGFSTVDLLWCAGPAAYSLLDLVPHRLSCYRLADRLDQFKRIPGNVEMLQKEIIKRVDFVIATSHSLCEWAGTIRKDHVYYIPNGVSELFLKPQLIRPEDMPGNGQPVAVYAGTLDTRFDLDMLGYAVEKMPHLHFLIIGPVSNKDLLAGLKTLQDNPNFSWLGPKSYQELPGYLQNSTVGIIPFYLNDLTEAVNPIKYYEYTASGLPVVAPPMRELVAMRGPLLAYKSRTEFCAALQEGVDRWGDKREQLIAFAARNTWQNRFEAIMEVVEEGLARGKGD